MHELSAGSRARGRRLLGECDAAAPRSAGRRRVRALRSPLPSALLARSPAPPGTACLLAARPLAAASRLSCRCGCEGPSASASRHSLAQRVGDVAATGLPVHDAGEVRRGDRQVQTDTALRSAARRRLKTGNSRGLFLLFYALL